MRVEVEKEAKNTYCKKTLEWGNNPFKGWVEVEKDIKNGIL